MNPKIILRKISLEDCVKISQAFSEQSWNKAVSQYQLYVQYQEQGIRDVIIAEFEGVFAGYLTIHWKSDYTAFREKGIPEVVDLNVLKKFQRKGIASRLMEEAESRIKKVSPFAGIGFGLTKDYGAAQILYINRGYKPDGNGLVKNSRSLSYGEQVTVGDDLVFYLIKSL
ncbi:MAG: GNAT family N-acetyltransferase [Bacteroidota bacterium]